MGFFDGVLLIILLFSAFLGAFRGVAKELMSLAGLIAAVYVAFKFSGMISDQYINRFLDQEKISYIIAFGLLFFITLFIVGLINLTINQMIKFTGLSVLNRFLGIVFGLLRGGIFCSIIVGVTTVFGLENMQWRKESVLSDFFESTYSMILSLVSSDKKTQFDPWLEQLKIEQKKQEHERNPKKEKQLNIPKVVLETAESMLNEKSDTEKNLDNEGDLLELPQRKNNQSISLESID